jgi:XTP/dITP diphosphohydrolase
LRRFASQPAIPAQFRCVLALARSGKLLSTFEGTVGGTIVDPPRGDRGFGYDPVFQPIGSGQTFAEFSPAAKNRVSHRAQAIRGLRTALAE